MGWAYFPTFSGPNATVCEQNCDHTDCNYWKNVNRDCAICGKRINDGEKVYMRRERFVHAVCVWEEAEKEQSNE